jgi:hypothetical protein
MSNWFQQSVVDPGRLRLFCFFVAFIAAFAFIRFSVRMIRAQVKWQRYAQPVHRLRIWFQDLIAGRPDHRA